MIIEYYIANPAGNVTALVTTDCGDRIKAVAQEIMSIHSNVEQVGFVDFTGDNIKLRMSGDEFCGNATMSAAALYCKLKKKQGRYETAVSVYGTDYPIKTAVSENDGCFNCECCIKKPERIEKIDFEFQNRTYTYPIVCFKGISHIIADEFFSESVAEAVIKDIAKKLSAKALGIMIFNKDKMSMKPLVYVTDVDTLFFENSCASGTCAVSAVYGEGGEMTISQPGGKLRVLNSDEIMLFSKVTLSKCYSEVL